MTEISDGAEEPASCRRPRPNVTRSAPIERKTQKKAPIRALEQISLKDGSASMPDDLISPEPAHF
jgi:hypothetical protein